MLLADPELTLRAEHALRLGTVDLRGGDPAATRYDELTYHDVLSKDLKVMDASAIALMRDSGIPIVVFSIRENNSLRRTLTGEGTFTVISSKSAS